MNESYLWLVDVATGEKTAGHAEGRSEGVAYGPARFAPTARASTSRPTASRSSSAWPTSTSRAGKHTYLTAQIPWDVEDFALSPDGRTIAFVTNEEGLSVAAPARHGERARRSPRRGCRPASSAGSSGRSDGRELGLLAHLGALALRRVLARRRHRQGRALDRERDGRPERGQRSPSPSSCAGRASTGARSRGFLYRPAARFTGQRPVIINIHGGPEGQSRPGFLGRNNYFLNELGVAVVYPNVRGSIGIRQDVRDARQRHEARGLGQGHRRAPRLDRDAPDLDASRVMVTGGSYGGYMTLAVATHYDARIALLARRRRDLELRDVPREHRELPARPAARRVRRRARPGDARVPAPKIAPVNNAGTDHEAAVRGPGPQRPARAVHRVGADGRDRQEERRPGLVPARGRRGPRLRQEEERRTSSSTRRSRSSGSTC